VDCQEKKMTEEEIKKMVDDFGGLCPPRLPKEGYHWMVIHNRQGNIEWIECKDQDIEVKFPEAVIINDTVPEILNDEWIIKLGGEKSES